MVNQNKKEFVISVKDSLRQALPLMTRKREHFVVKRAAGCGMPAGSSDNNAELCELRNKIPDSGPEYFLFFGEPVWSREQISADAYKKYDILLQMKDMGAEILTPPVTELYRLCAGKTLVLPVSAADEKGANDRFVRKLLRLGVNPGQWYISDSFAELKIMINEVANQYGRGEKKTREKVPAGTAKEGIRSFDLWDSLLERLSGNEYGYGNDVSIWYDMTGGGGTDTYFIMESYYNHRWCLDPAGLLNIRISLDILNDTKTPEDVRFSHLAKYIHRISDGKPYFVNKMEMDCSRLGIPGYHKQLLENQVFDNPVDFNAWVYLYHHDIHLA